MTLPCARARREGLEHSQHPCALMQALHYAGRLPEEEKHCTQLCNTLFSLLFRGISSSF